MKNFVKVTFIALLFSSIFLACKKTDTDIMASQSNVSVSQMITSLNSLSNTKWSFVNYSKTKLATEFENKAEVKFSNFNNNKAQYSGTSFINGFTGTFLIDQSKGLIIKDENPMGISSLAFSLDAATAKADQDFISNLTKATGFEFNDTKLTIYLGDKSNANTEVMTFVKK